MVVNSRERSVFRFAIDGLFPRFCLGCHREGELWCETCSAVWWPKLLIMGCPFCGVGSVAMTCQTCKQETFLDGLWAFAAYGNPVVREAILQWKYVGDRTIEPILQQWLHRAAPSFFRRAQDAVFVPVPLHVRRRRARGFDQSGILADWCGQFFSRPVFDLLVRSSFTKPQALRLENQRRVGELDGIFRLHPYAQELPNHVVLVDDVFTSGATMDSAARVVKESGVERVTGFVLAKGK